MRELLGKVPKSWDENMGESKALQTGQTRRGWPHQVRQATACTALPGARPSSMSSNRVVVMSLQVQKGAGEALHCGVGGWVSCTVWRLRVEQTADRPEVQMSRRAKCTVSRMSHMGVCAILGGEVWQCAFVCCGETKEEKRAAQ